MNWFPTVLFPLFPCAAGIPNEREVSERVDEGAGHDDGRKSDIHGETIARIEGATLVFPRRCPRPRE